MPATARGQRTRELIITSTAKVFGQQGYAGATLSRLVESTGLTRGAFYFHFESKDALAVAIAEEQAARWQQLREQVERQEEAPLRRLISLYSCAAFAFRDDPKTRAVARLLMDSVLIEQEMPRTAPWWLDVISGYLHRADSQGQLSDLSSLQLVPSQPSADDGVDRFAANLLAQMASIGMIAAARPDSQFELQYAAWATVLPRICADASMADELLVLARELLLPGATRAPNPLP